MDARLLSAMERVKAHQVKPFIAPVCDAEDVKILSIQDSIPYHLTVIDPRPGWWWLRPIRYTARIDRPADLADITVYMGQMPYFVVIVAMGLPGQSALVVPFNRSDATQRGWPRCVPRQMHLVGGTVLPFDIVLARSLGSTLLFGHHLYTDPVLTSRAQRAFMRDEQVDLPPEFTVAWQIADQRRRQVKEEARLQEMQEQRRTTEGEMRYQLEFMGAQLLNWREAGNVYVVEWSFDGKPYQMQVGRNMRIQSAGICLAGTASYEDDYGHTGTAERLFDLSSIVTVMEEARKSRRFDLPDDYYV